jgi:phage I-like protein
MPNQVSKDTFFYCVKLSENTSQIEIMRTGTWKHPVYGNFSITENDLDDFILHFIENVRGIDIAIDLEHGETPHKSASAGWIKHLTKQGNSLLAEIEWTDLGKEKLKSKEYKYFSPEFKFSYEDHETGKKYSNVLMGGGLTNRPFIKNMQPVLLSEDVQIEAHQDNTSFIYMQNIEKERIDKKMNAKLLTVLKLSENATEEQVSEAIENVVKENETLTKEVETKTNEIADKNKEITEKTTENVELSEKIKTLTSNKTDLEKDNIKLSERITSIETKLVESEWEKVSSKLLSEGKLTPAMAEKFKVGYMKDKETTLALMETLQPIVELGERGNSQGNNEVKSNIELFENEVNTIVANRKVSYADALVLAEKEKPELFNLYQKERGVH